MERVGESNSYFSVRTVPCAGTRWTYADATNVLLLVFGLTERSRRMALIRQYRPPVDASVLSVPMGCFSDAAVEELLPVAAAEAEAESGHHVLRIRHLLDYARSPGMTTERARCFVACYAEAAGPRRLHADEEIEVQYVLPDSVPQVIEHAVASGSVLDSSILLCEPWLLGQMERVRTSQADAGWRTYGPA